MRAPQWWSAGVEAGEDGADIVMMSGPVGFNGRRSTVKGIPFDDHRHPSRDSDAAKFRGVYRDSWEMLWMTAIHMKAGCEFMLMGVDW